MATRRYRLALAPLLILLMLVSPTSGALAATPTGRIAYQGDDGKLHVVAADGGGDRVLATRGRAYTPHWSPVSGELVYSDELAGDRPQGELVVLDPASGASRVLVEPALRDPELGTYWSYLQPRWSHDGRDIYYLLSGGSRITTLMRVPAAGGALQELTYGVNSTRFDVSPLDSKLAVVDNAFPEERVQGSRLILLDANGTNERTLLPRNGTYYYQPTWLPDGRSVAVRRQAEANSATSELIAIDTVSGAQRTLGTLPGGSTYTFSPDGRWLVYAAADGKRVTVVSLDDATDRREIGAGVAPAWEPRASRAFPETGFTVSGRFLAYWEAHGGLAINGFPIGPERTETLEDGKPYLVQYFERVRLEYHPENPDPAYQVLLGQFGRRIHGGADPGTGPAAGARFFAETGHNLAGDFRAYWEANGGLAQFGFPITEVFTETLEDGKPYEVQYFERARFERHPEQPEPYKVLLGQFGRRILGGR